MVVFEETNFFLRLYTVQKSLRTTVLEQIHKQTANLKVMEFGEETRTRHK